MNVSDVLVTNMTLLVCQVLRPMVRTLFRLPRRKGKSVWATCMRDHSPCFWFTGEHYRGEHFVTQVPPPCCDATPRDRRESGCVAGDCSERQHTSFRA